MIQLTKGNLLEVEAEALVNTVNCIGHMGKGIALQFKKAFPDNYKEYASACKAGNVRPGKMFIFETRSMWDPKYIINFPTKRHWKGNSKIEDIKSGLKALIKELQKRNIKSVAVPPLGCGLGGLDWKTVRTLITKAFNEAPDVNVMLFEPTGTPKAGSMPVRTKKPGMTVARALFIRLIKSYSKLAYRLTLLEVQKLAYFLQEAGEPLKLKYKKAHYGPYAHNLNKVMEILESHYIRGYGDTQKPDVEIELLPEASDVAGKYLSKHKNSVSRLNKVTELIQGFETPYGMELLSSVHWIAKHESRPAKNQQEAVQMIHLWNDRKKKMFVPDHIEVAWNWLYECGWV